jgi:polyphenol oxidase
MIIHLDSRCSIFFGDASTCPIGHKEAQHKIFCDELRQQLGLSYLVRQYQVHGIDGWSIYDMSKLSCPLVLEEQAGDFLITNQPGVGIAVKTADCLPIIFYLPEQKIVAIAHAGWKGSVAGIATKVLEEIARHHDFELSQVQAYFGPAARSCCYEVQPDFLANISSKDVIDDRNGKYYFDNSLFNKKQLIKHGLLPQNINDTYNLCTICNHQFHSFRRSTDKEDSSDRSLAACLNSL